MSRTVRAPIDLVWKVWTQPEYIAEWWGPDHHTTTIHHMDFREGGEWKLTLHNHANGQDYPNRSVFKEIIPFKKIVFEHFNPHFIATVEFEALGQETRIEWSSLFDTKEMLETVINVFNARKGQAQNFDRLERYLKQAETMKNNLLFDFSVNRENNTIIVKREFDAGLELVWKAWTTSGLLDQWWGPEPWRAETKTMIFEEGGFWLYAMVGPEGEKHWSKMEYISIVEEKSFSGKDGFCDENGTMNPEFPQNLWESLFTATGGQVLVTVTLTFDHLADLEQTIAMGFREGFTMGLNQLDKLLLNLKQ